MTRESEEKNVGKEKDPRATQNIKVRIKEAKRENKLSFALSKNHTSKLNRDWGSLEEECVNRVWLRWYRLDLDLLRSSLRGNLTTIC